MHLKYLLNEELLVFETGQVNAYFEVFVWFALFRLLKSGFDAANQFFEMVISSHLFKVPFLCTLLEIILALA